MHSEHAGKINYNLTKLKNNLFYTVLTMGWMLYINSLIITTLWDRL